MISGFFKEERGSYAIPAMYIVAALLSLLLVLYGLSRYWVGVLAEDIQAKLDMSSMACYPNLNIENLADTASVALEEVEARRTFELILRKQLNVDSQPAQAAVRSAVQHLQIDKFKIYRANEVPVTFPGGRTILHSPAIESQITAQVRIPFIDRIFPFTFRSVTDLPQTP